MRFGYPVAATTLGLLVMTLGCEPQEDSHQYEQVAASNTISHAVAVMNPTEGNEARGVVTFAQTDSGISVVADLVGLEPGPLGFHIHEFGDCSASDGTSAGGHFNPAGTEHGAPTGSVRHAGDFGNIVADSTGAAHLQLTDTHITFSGDISVIGRGVIVHAGADDLTSQPTGAAGARVACGVVGVARQ